MAPYTTLIPVRSGIVITYPPRIAESLFLKSNILKTQHRADTFSRRELNTLPQVRREIFKKGNSQSPENRLKSHKASSSWGTGLKSSHPPRASSQAIHQKAVPYVPMACPPESVPASMKVPGARGGSELGRDDPPHSTCSSNPGDYLLVVGSSRRRSSLAPRIGSRRDLAIPYKP